MDPPIIITGGSVTVEFDEVQLPKQGNGKFGNANKKIKTVLIEGDYDPQTGRVTNGNVKITVSYDNGNSNP
jgi:hypothetical protein